MLKKLSILFLFLLFPIVSSATDVTVKAFVYQDYTIYNYAIEFQTNDSISKFSIEKPKDAQIDYAVDKFGTVNYDSAGDYFIFKSKDIQENYFLVKFHSEEDSNNIFKTDAFRTYLSFDFPVNNLKFNIDFKDNFGEGIDIFPSSFTMDDSDRILWEFENVSEDLLFVVNFKDSKSNIETGSVNKDLIYLSTIIVLFVIIGIFTTRYYIKRKTKSLKNKKKIDEVILDNTFDNNLESKSNDPKALYQENNKKSIDEIIEMHLTENEGEVLLLVKENEGISQYDILNYLPKLTKSNLSKIISKLHVRKILNRIKVGKVNKIYLGDRIRKEEED